MPSRHAALGLAHAAPHDHTSTSFRSIKREIYSQNQ
jgi:hypothetical protein